MKKTVPSACSYGGSRSCDRGLLLLAALCALSLGMPRAAWAGNTCTWTGLGGDGKWSTAANWQDAGGTGNVPVSGNDDNLVFIAGANPLTVENDVEGFTVGSITTTNSTETVATGVTLKGKALAFSGATVNTTRFRGYCATTFEMPVTVKVIMKFFFRATADFIFKDDLTLDVSGTVRMGGGRVNPKPVITPSVYFHGAVTGADAQLDAVNDENNGSQHYYHYGPVILRQYDAGMEYRNNDCHFHATGNDIKTLRVVGYGSAYAETANAFAADNQLVQVASTYPSHITPFHVKGDTTFAKIAVDPSRGSGRTCLKGSKTLTLAAEEDHDLPRWILDESVNFRWAPTDDRSLTLSYATNATTGAVFIDRGTLKIGSGVTFGNLRKMSLSDATALEIASGSADCFGTSPNVVLHRASSATVRLDADVKVKSVYIDGVLQTNATFSAANGDSWITGTGTLTVTAPAGATVTSWDGAAGGDYNTATNWTRGIPTDSVTGYITKWNGRAVISEPTTVPGTLKLFTTVGTTTLETAADVTSSGAVTIGDGTGPGTAVLKVTAGTNCFTKAPVLNRDGRIDVTGGTLDIRNQFSTAGGAINLSGNAVMADSRTDSVFQYRFRSGTLTLGDQAKLVTRGGGNGRNFFSPASAGDTMLIEVKDDAAFDLSPGDGTYLGKDAPANSVSKLVLSGRARAKTGNSLNILESASAGATCELLIRDSAYYQQGSYGLLGGSSANTTFTLRMTGGCLDCAGTCQDRYQTVGIKIGHLSANARSSAKANGVFYFEDGIVTNRSYGMTVLGAGNSVGRIVQTGGTYIAKPSTWNRPDATFKTPPIILGYLGGEGYWEMSGGEVRNTTMLFVGGVTTNALGHFYKPDWTSSFSYPVNRSAEKGVLTLTGGLFENEGDAYVSYDGPGTIEIGAAGELRARNLHLTHSTDKEDPSVTHIAKLKFTPGAETSGSIVLTGALDVETDAELVVDARAYTAKCSVWLVKAAGGVTRSFAPGKITLERASTEYSLRCDGQGVKLLCHSGTVLFVR